jgi:hypothetical protein
VLTNSRPVHEGGSDAFFPEPPERTIDEYLADSEALAQNESAAGHIEEDLEVLLRESRTRWTHPLCPNTTG